MNKISYKGYIGTVITDFESGVLHGAIELINDVVTYEAETVPELKIQFEIAVEDYIQSCAELGKEPEKTFTGKTNVRISPELHKAVALAAVTRDRTLNAEIVAALQSWVAPKKGRRDGDATTTPKAFSLNIGTNDGKPKSVTLSTRPTLTVVPKAEVAA
jgi:predicted HicB family RNase H-like nuclease